MNKLLSRLMVRKKLSNYLYLLVFIVSIAFSCLLKISFIDAKELWLDESYSAYIISLPFLELIRHIIGDVHPPIYYIFLKYWSLIVGDSPNNLRFLSVMYSITQTIVFYFLIKRILRDKWIVMLCFLQIQFSPILFYYSVEVRPYILAILLVTISLYFYIGMIEEPRLHKSYILFSIFAAFSFYTHYFTIFILLAFFIHYLFVTNFQFRNRQLIISIIIFLLLIGPWVPVVIHQRSLKASMANTIENARKTPTTLNYGSIPKPPSTSKYFTKIYRFISINTFKIYDYNRGGNFTESFNIVLRLVVSISFLIAIFKKNKFASLVVIIFCFYTFLSFIFMPKVFVPRYYLGLALFCIIGFGIALQQMKHIFLGHYLILVIGFLALVGNVEGTIHRVNRFYCKPYTYTVQMLKNEYRPCDIIVFNSLIHQVPFDYYAKQLNFSALETGFPINIYNWWKSEEIKGWSGPVVKRTELDSFVIGLASNPYIKRIWLLIEEKPPYDPRKELLKKMSEIFNYTKTFELEQCKDAIDRKPFYIYLFTKKPKESPIQ
mgnify:CR=1 FL=1